MNESLGPIALIVLVIPAVALRIATRVLYGRRPLACADGMFMLLSMASTLLFVAAILGITAGVWILFVPLPLVVAAIAVMILSRTRQAEHRSLIDSLATAAQHSVALSESARAYADESLGDTGLRAMAVAEAIERGQPLSTAVRTGRLWMTSATKLAVRVGEQLGLLGPAMRQQIDDSQEADLALRSRIGQIFYLGILFGCMLFVISFVMWKIVPVFDKMFQEFGLKLPAPTVAVINFSRWYLIHGWWMTLPVALLVPVFFLFSFFYFLGWAPRDLPVIWWFFRRYDGALVMRSLALAMRRGMALPQAMRMVADCYPIHIIGEKLRGAADRVASGMDWRESLLRAGLIAQADAAVLAAAERAGNLEWALEQMSDSAIRRQVYWLQAVLQVLLPLVLMAFGMAVGFFVIGLFIPIVSLIQGLA